MQSDGTLAKVTANGRTITLPDVPMRTMTESEIDEAARRDPDALPMDSGHINPVLRIRSLRRSLNLTQEQFADRYQIPLGTLRDWEQGRSQPDQPARAYLKLIAQNAEPPPLTKRERLRRVVILSQSFIRNLAYYRAGKSPAAEHLLKEKHKEASFWRQVNGNCLDMCVLEWCKLFGDRNGVQGWRNVISEPTAFEDKLFEQLRISRRDLDELTVEMRRYHNKFVAHLDEDRTMFIPQMDLALRTVYFYVDYLIEVEAAPGDLAGLVTESRTLRDGFKQCSDEASEIFRRALPL